MSKLDIQGLKLAIDTGNPDFYNGRLDEALSELVDEMEAVRLVLEDVGMDDVAELAKFYTEDSEAKEDFLDSRVETFKDCKVEWDSKTDQHKIYDPGGMMEMLVDSSDISTHENYEVIVRVIR